MNSTVSGGSGTTNSNTSSRGTQSWSGIRFLVYSREALLPAKLEAQIANAMPQLEAMTDSFEDYEEALDHCKIHANVAVFLIHENCGQHTIQDIFRNLAKPYKASGWPVLGAVIRKSQSIDSIHALKAMKDDSDIVCYLSEDDFTTPERIFAVYEELWAEYVGKLEESLIPDALKATFHSVFETVHQAEDRIFYDRMNEMLTAPLNLTWKEKFQTRWNYVLSEVGRINSTVLEPHTALKMLTQVEGLEFENQNLLAITSSKKSLNLRAIETGLKVLSETRKGNLIELLTEAKREARPGRPGLLRTLAANSPHIQAIYDNVYHGIYTLERKAA